MTLKIHKYAPSEIRTWDKNKTDQYFRLHEVYENITSKQLAPKHNSRVIIQLCLISTAKMD